MFVVCARYVENCVRLAQRFVPLLSLTETHLHADATDNFCPQAMLLRQDAIELNMLVECLF